MKNVLDKEVGKFEMGLVNSDCIHPYITDTPMDPLCSSLIIIDDLAAKFQQGCWIAAGKYFSLKYSIFMCASVLEEGGLCSNLLKPKPNNYRINISEK